MTYLSQIIGKTVYYQDQPFGKIVDMAVFENRPHPPVSKVEIKRGKKKLTLAPTALHFENGKFTLISQHTPLLPYDHKDFYLAEDLLDKQVIDIDGKRLVRVNDVIIDMETEIKVEGIDVGFAGILRRLGIGPFMIKSRVIPWEFIQAFDYQTGNVQIKLAQSKLNSLHPSELADILEDAGSRERLGIVAALDAKKAARAIEETNNQTQISILEELPATGFKEILNKMHAAELADVFRYLNPLRKKEIQSVIGEEMSARVKKLLKFSSNTAGGLMHPTFFAVDKNTTVKETIKKLNERDSAPGSIVVTNGNSKYVGIVNTRNLLISDPLSLMGDIIKDKKFTYPHVPISSILKLFADYNLRTLPVVDKDKKPMGVILIDDLLKAIVEEDEDEIL